MGAVGAEEAVGLPWRCGPCRRRGNGRTRVLPGLRNLTTCKVGGRAGQGQRRREGAVVEPGLGDREGTPYPLGSSEQ